MRRGVASALAAMCLAHGAAAVKSWQQPIATRPGGQTFDSHLDNESAREGTSAPFDWCSDPKEARELHRHLAPELKKSMQHDQDWYRDWMRRQPNKVERIRKARRLERLRSTERRHGSESEALSIALEVSGSPPPPDCPGGGHVKTVFFVRHALADCGLDPDLNVERGRPVARKLADFPELVDAQVLFVSPACRTLETALLGFGNLPLEMHIAADLLEIHEAVHAQHGSALLNRYNATLLLEEYQNVTAVPNYHGVEYRTPGTPGARVQQFENMILQRPEERMIVVGHFHIFELMGLHSTENAIPKECKICSSTGEKICRKSGTG